VVVSVARYLLDEAASGTTPTECADDENSNTLTIDYSSGDAVWVEPASNKRGLDFTRSPAQTDTAIAELADISTNGNVGSSLDSVTQASLLMVVTVENGSDLGARIFHIGTSSGNGDFGVIIQADGDVGVRWDNEGGGSGIEKVFTGPTWAGLQVIAVIIDTPNATAALRMRVFVDDSELTGTGADITQNVAIDAVNATNRSICIGNRPSQNRNIEGAIFYCELFTGILTATEITDSKTALLANNDADWQAGGGGGGLPAGSLSLMGVGI